MNELVLEKLFLKAQEKYFYSNEIFDSGYSGQYHIAAYILSLSHLSNKYPNDNQYLNCIEELLSYLDKEWKKGIGTGSADFSLESICLAHYYITDEVLKSKIRDFLLSNIELLKKDITAKATDYYYLRYFNCLYYSKLLNVSIQVPDYIVELIDKTSSNSGIMFDSFHGDKGSPDLAYHNRNLQILTSCLILLGDQKLEKMVINGFEYILKLSSREGRISYYGRTADLIYGDASLYMAISLIFKSKPKGIWKDFLERFKTLYLDPSCNKLWVNPYQLDVIKRNGMDSYVYPMVYELYSLSRLWCSIYEINFAKDYNIEIKQELDYVFLDKESGFLKIRRNDYEVSMNLLGHQLAPIRPNDNRYMPLFPYLYRNDIVPHAPFQAIEKKENDSVWRKVYRKILEKLISYKYSKMNLGFIPCFKTKGSYYVIAECNILSSSDVSAKLSVQKTYRYNSLTKKEYLTSFSSCTPKLSLFFHQKLEMKCNVESDTRCYYQISCYSTDKMTVVGKRVLINGIPLLEFSVSLKIKKGYSSKLNSISGCITVRILEVETLNNEYSVTYL